MGKIKPSNSFLDLQGTLFYLIEEHPSIAKIQILKRMVPHLHLCGPTPISMHILLESDRYCTCIGIKKNY
jgi:hypothetical protein